MIQKNNTGVFVTIGYNAAMKAHTDRLVMKFGGTSVADMTRIRHAATLIQAEVEAGRNVAVVVSAMAGVTNQYVTWTDVAGPPADGLGLGEDEYDVVVSAGEQVTAGLMTMVLQNLGVQARSWLGWQIPIKTDDAHGQARILDVSGDALGPAIDTGQVAVIPGFQGVTADGRIATLGRGGSDTTAVAVAAALGAPCDIYTDVDGVYTADPRLVPHARRLAQVSYEEMLEMAALGARVLAARSVELACSHKVPVRVLSSFAKPGSPKVGTLITHKENVMEHRVISSVACSMDEAKMTLHTLPDRPGTVAKVFDLLASQNINIDMVVQARSEASGCADITLTMPRRQLDTAVSILEKNQNVLGFSEIKSSTTVAKLSLVGVGMQSHHDVAKTMFATLADLGANIQAISKSEIKISVLIEQELAEAAVKALHASFDLSQPKEAVTVHS